MNSKSSCKERTLEYLSSQNRPYSANDVMQNLHNEFRKTAIQQALDDLTSECKIKEKTYGKQKVYSVMQEVESGDVALELGTLDSRIEGVTESLKSTELELKKVEGALKELESEPSTERALNEKNELEATLAQLKQRVDVLSNTSLEMTEKEKNKILNDFEYYSKEHKKRRQICMDIVNSIMENYPKKLKSLFEEIGIEADEA